MASASSTTAFFILFFLVASPFPAPAAHEQLDQNAYAPMPLEPYPAMPENASEQLPESLHRLETEFSELIDPTKPCNLEETVVHAIHETLRLVSEVEQLLCQDFKTVESHLLPLLPQLTGQLLHLQDSLPSELKNNSNLSSLSSTVLHVVEYLVCKVKV